MSVSQLLQWRRAAPRRHAPLALVSGTFDILQPGNWAILEAAARQAPWVCVLVEPDDVAAAHAGPGRPQHALAERAELATYLRAVSAVTSFPPQESREILRRLKPFTWVACLNPRHADPYGDAAAATADKTAGMPAATGCFTEDIHDAIRREQTPIRVPAACRSASAAVETTAQKTDADASGQVAKRLLNVTANGCFDILHIGHLRFLADARALGDRLTVLINADASVQRFKGPTRPVFPLEFRRAALLALESVAQVLPFAEDTPLEALARLKPDIHVKGGSFIEERVRAERARVEGWAGKLAFLPLVDGYSTSEFIRKVLAQK